MSSFFVVDSGPSNDTVYVGGGRKKDLERILGYKVISKHDWGNWKFLIHREDLLRLYKACGNLTESEKARLNEI